MLNLCEKCVFYVFIFHVPNGFLFHACVALYLHFVLNIGNKMVSEMEVISLVRCSTL